MDRRDDAEAGLVPLDERADAFERAIQLAFLLFCLFGREEDRVVVIAQCGKHPIDGAIGHAHGIDVALIDKVLVDQIPYLPEYVELRRMVGGERRARHEAGRRTRQKHERQCTGEGDPHDDPSDSICCLTLHELSFVCLRELSTAIVNAF